jgi:hypothetical protein
MMTMFHANSPRSPRPAKLTSANITRSVFTIQLAPRALVSSASNNNRCMTAFIEKTLAEKKNVGEGYLF